MKYAINGLLFVVLLSSCYKNNEPGAEIFSFTPGKGAEGNAVTIRGAQFGDSPDKIRVYFNGVPSSMDSFSDTLLVVKVPGGATTGKIAISKAGKTDVSEEDFVIFPGHWIQMSNLPSGFAARGLAAGFAIDTIGYFGMGYASSGLKNDMMAFDPASNIWTPRAASPGSPIQSPVSMVIGNYAYIGIGKTENLPASPEFWQYDPAADSWTRKADLPDTVSEGAFGVGFGDKGYVGIIPHMSGKKAWWEYDPANNTWTSKADFPGTAMDWPCGFALHGKIYIGLSSLQAPHEWWQYDPAMNQWKRMNDFPGSLAFAGSGFVIGDKGYVAGGECWQYNDQSDSWAQMAFINRSAGSTFSIRDKGYYVGGGNLSTQNFFPEIWEFTPPK
jgi:hypothetical protein